MLRREGQFRTAQFSLPLRGIRLTSAHDDRGPIRCHCGSEPAPSAGGTQARAKDRQRARRRSADQPARRLPASQGPARLQPGIGIDQRHTADLRDQQAGLRPAQPVAGPILVLMHSARPCKADRTLARSSNAIYLFGIVLTYRRIASAAPRGDASRCNREYRSRSVRRGTESFDFVLDAQLPSLEFADQFVLAGRRVQSLV